MSPSNFNHLNLSEQAEFGSLTTPIISNGAVIAQKLGTLASVVIQDITYTAATGGTTGNSISITYLENTLPGQETVVVSGSAITVNIGNSVIDITRVLDSTHFIMATTAGIQVGDTITQGLQSTTVSSIVSSTELQVGSTSGFVIGLANDNGLLSTATQVLTVVQNSHLATVLVTAVITGTPSNKQVGTSSTPLSGGLQYSSIVTSLHADAHADLSGDVQLVSGTNITLSQTGQAITINASGGTPPASPNMSIQFNNSGSFGGSANLTWDGTNLNAAGFVVIGNTGLDIYQTIGYTGNDQIHLDIDGSASFLNGAITLDSSFGLFLANKNYVTFGGTSSGTIAVSAPHVVTSGSYTIYLPPLHPTIGQVLSVTGQDADASGAWDLTWSTPSGSPGGSTTQFQYNNSGSFGGVPYLVYDGTHVNSLPAVSDGVNLQIFSPANHLGGIGYFDGYANGSSLQLFTDGTTDSVGLVPNSGLGIQVGGSGTESQVVINPSDPTVFTPSATLELVSTTKGFLPTRMTTTQKDVISSPAEGLIVYDTTLHKLALWTSSAWETVTTVLASVSGTAQHADIPVTTIYTSPVTGMYSLNVYMVTTASDLGADNSSFTYYWTDDEGTKNNDAFSLDLTTLGSYQFGAFIVEAAAGSPIQFSIIENAGTYRNARYSYYVSIQNIS